MSKSGSASEHGSTRSTSLGTRSATSRVRSLPGSEVMSTRSTRTADQSAATQETVAEFGGNGQVPHLSVAERVARGKAERAEVPRGVHAEWSAPSARRGPIELLEEQAESRVP